jgi:hypothetical protein
MASSNCKWQRRQQQQQQQQQQQSENQPSRVPTLSKTAYMSSRTHLIVGQALARSCQQLCHLDLAADDLGRRFGNTAAQVNLAARIGAEVCTELLFQMVAPCL